MTTATENPIPLPAKSIRSAVLVLSLITAMSAIPGIYLGIGSFGGFAWGMFGFEALVLCSSILGILLGLGKITDGFALAVLCIVGTMVVGAVFGIHFDARTKIADNATFVPWVNRMLLIRLVLIAGFASCASVAVFSRDARCWKSAFMGVAFLAPVLVSVVLLRRFGFPFSGGQDAEPGALSVISFLLIALVLGIMISAGGHFLIRAFEIGQPGKSPAKGG